MRAKRFHFCQSSAGMLAVVGLAVALSAPIAAAQERPSAECPDLFDEIWDDEAIVAKGLSDLARLADAMDKTQQEKRQIDTEWGRAWDEYRKENPNATDRDFTQTSTAAGFREKMNAVVKRQIEERDHQKELTEKVTRLHIQVEQDKADLAKHGEDPDAVLSKGFKDLSDLQDRIDETRREYDKNDAEWGKAWDDFRKSNPNATDKDFTKTDTAKTFRDKANALLKAERADEEKRKELTVRVTRLHLRIEGQKTRLAKLSCPAMPAMTPAQHFYLIIQMLKNSGQMGLAETLAATGEQTFSSTDRVDPLGVGFGAGYLFAPWDKRFQLGPFATFDLLNQTINHTFPGGSFIGTRSHWIATLGAKAGVAASPSLFIYGLGGLALLNQDLNINFGGPVTSANSTTPGFTAGIGGEFALRALGADLGIPVAAFLQYQHTWWQDARLNQPAASPLFNYTFRREDDTVKFGLNVYLGGVDVSAVPSAGAGK